MDESLNWRLRLECKKYFFHDLTIPCSIGVYDHERQTLQPIIVNVDYWLHSSKCSSCHDQLTEVLDYTTVIKTIVDIVQSKHHELQETLLDHISNTLINRFPQIVLLHLSMSKPQAYAMAKCIGVEVYKEGQAFQHFLLNKD